LYPNVNAMSSIDDSHFLYHIGDVILLPTYAWRFFGEIFARSDVCF